jgi:nucleotide-binding universal stress UspA family protein
VTIIAGFSASRQGSAPLHLAAQLARTTGEKIIAAAVLETTTLAKSNPLERRYLDTQADHTLRSLSRLVDEMRPDVDITPIVHRAKSIAGGLLELAAEHGAEVVAVGSSSTGLLGRITLGSVTDRLVHTARVPVAIAPRGYPEITASVNRLTVAYGGAADSTKPIQAAAELATAWGATLRIASFTVQPALKYGGSIERSAEDLVTEQWARKTEAGVRKQLDKARAKIPIPDVDLVIGTGTEWSDAVNDVPWMYGDLLVLGSGAAGKRSQVFLGSAAAKILRHVPVPVMIVPRPKS